MLVSCTCGYAYANQQSIMINAAIAKQMFIGAADNRFSLADTAPLSYEQLLASQHQPYLWFTKNKLNLSGLSLVSLLNDLGISYFPYQQLERGVNISKLDQQLSQELLYIASLFNGYQLKPIEKPPVEIAQAVKNNSLATYVDLLLPQFDEVVRLRAAMAVYRKLSQTKWPKLDKNISFKLGQGHKNVAKVRQILAALGDLDQSRYSKYRQHIFDPEVILALKSFQARHGLKANGKFTHNTIAALNRTPQERIKTMQINLWRWLSLPSFPPKRYLKVNIPSFQLSLIENQQPSVTMKVIVGDKKHPTPIMVTQVGSITVNPIWTPTYNIIHKELLPENAQNPGSLKRQNFKLAKGYGNNRTYKNVFTDSAAIKSALKEYKLVQAPGDNNALGKYRFNIKNFHSVYLHDTPAKRLFNQAYRALSHGCVRLQHANKLAEHFLASGMFAGDLAANKAQVQQVIKSKKMRHFALAEPVPVYLTYHTVLVTPAGKVHWQNDIYQQDKKLLARGQANSQSDATVSNVVLVQP